MGFNSGFKGLKNKMTVFIWKYKLPFCLNKNQRKNSKEAELLVSVVNGCDWSEIVFRLLYA